MKYIIVVLIFSVLSTGCTTFKYATKNDDLRLKHFVAPQGKAGIYVYRNQIKGNILLMDIDVDGQHLGRTQWETYLYTEVVPGKHTITSRASNDHSIEIDVKAGSLNYVWQEVKYGLPTARTELHIVSEKEGKRGVLESKLSGRTIIRQSSDGLIFTNQMKND